MNRRHIAFHEAAHAVMGLHHGRTVVKVSIPDRECQLDNAYLDRVLGGSQRLLLDEQAFLGRDVEIRMAGHVGEKLGTGEAPDPRGMADDLKKANDVIKAIRERGHWQATGGGLLKRVEKALLENRSALHRIAEALLREDVLSGEQLQHLYEQLDE